MRYLWIFKTVLGVFLILCMQFSTLKAGVVPIPTHKAPEKEYKTSKSFIQKIKKKLKTRWERSQKKYLVTLKNS
ncbi:MAG: hypothetical protein KatS3mg035_1651 [Bacteroidia bacterium]|nr:MAG: hypothetical protein KatS3mg035_1651 [Bacteroidia bacterium]